MNSPLGMPVWVALAAYYLTMAVVGLLVPENVLRDHSSAVEFCDFIAGLVPQIDRVTALGIHANVNRFYFSLLWASSPLLFMIVAIPGVLAWRTHQWPIREQSLKEAVVAIAITVSGTLVWPQTLWAVEPDMALTQFLFGTGIGRSFIAQAMFVDGSVVFLFTVGMMAYGWISGEAPKRMKERCHGR